MSDTSAPLGSDENPVHVADSDDKKNADPDEGSDYTYEDEDDRLPIDDQIAGTMGGVFQHMPGGVNTQEAYSHTDEAAEFFSEEATKKRDDALPHHDPKLNDPKPFRDISPKKVKKTEVKEREENQENDGFKPTP